MFVFRGLSNVVLGGQTLPIKNQAFVVLFGGGANCYVPDILGGGEGMNRLAMVVGIVACVIFVVVTMKGYLNRKKKGHDNHAPERVEKVRFILQNRENSTYCKNRVGLISVAHQAH